jgi:hypothetical protein
VRTSCATTALRTHSEPVSIEGYTFWLRDGGVITVIAGGYEAILGGIVQTGDYFWAASGDLQTIILMPYDGSPESTLNLVVTDTFGCNQTRGTYSLVETGQTGAYTATRYQTP